MTTKSTGKKTKETKSESSHEIHEFTIFPCVEVRTALLDDDRLPYPRVDSVLLSGDDLPVFFFPQG